MKSPEEIAAGLTKTQGRYLLQASTAEDGLLWPYGASQRKCIYNLMGKGLMGTNHHGAYGSSYAITPLGRQVAAVLRGEADR